MIRDYVRMALSNLLHRKTRSWLTLVGIFIGITAVVALISLGQGLEHALTAEFLELGADKMIVTAKSPVGNSAGQETKNQLRERDLAAIERSAGVLRAVPIWQRSSRVAWAGGDEVQYYPVFGTSEDPVELKVVEDFYTVKVGQGRGLKGGDSAKAVIGYGLTNPEELANPMKVGDKITLNATTFEVVGIYEKTGDPMADSGIFLGDKGFEDLFGIDDVFDGIIVQVDTGEDPEAVAASLRQTLRRERGLKEGEEDFDVQTPQDLVNTFNQIFGIVQFVLIGIAAISLIVGGIGIMNTMYTAVLERTKEIGIMKAIGAPNWAILTIFLIESGLLGLLGGLIGLLTGMGLAKITEYVGKTVLDTELLTALFPWWLVVGALAFAFVTGVASGILPAVRASRQQAVDSLRYE
jgi:putative ABC transport system permease protein